MNEWDDEPDHFDGEHAGYVYRVQRHSTFKSLCGYVRLPDSHPLYKVEYCAPLPAALAHIREVTKNGPIGARSPIQIFNMPFGDSARAGDQFDVHGGVTYSGGGYWLPEPDGFWYGFDCAHLGDLIPDHEWSDGEYRDLEYVKSHCIRLIDQLVHMDVGVTA